MNNNPYILPQKPMKQSNISVQSVPFYQSSNRRIDEPHFKQNQPPMMKRSSIGYAVQNQVLEPSRFSCVPHQQFKANIGQIHNFIYQDQQKEAIDDKNLKEINAKILNILNRLDVHQNKLKNLIDTTQTNSSLKDSVVNTLYSVNRKQVYGNDVVESINQIKEELARIKMEKGIFQIEREESLAFERETIATNLINQFKQCLKIKFQEQQSKIQEWMKQYNQNQNCLFEQKVLSMKFEVNRCMKEIEQLSLKSDDGKMSHFGFRLDKLKISSIKTNKEAYVLEYEDYFKVIKGDRKIQEIKVSERVYYIDSDGYLLDKDFYYLLDEHANIIKITQQQKQLLKLHSVLN